MAISTILSLGCPALFAQATNKLAPGAPGLDAHWPSAAKNGFGTSNTLASKVWFTLNSGVMTEACYPKLDVPNVQMLQLIIVGGTRVETESEDTIHRLEVVDSKALVFRQLNTAKSGNYTITKTYVTDPLRSTILIQIEYVGHPANNVYVYYDPSLNNSGSHDTAWNEGEALLSQDGDKASALISQSGFAHRDEWMRNVLKPSERAVELEISSGYLGASDGLVELKRNWPNSSFTPYHRAANGNVVQVAELKRPQGFNGDPVRRFTLALAFGKTPREALTSARASLRRGFTRIRREYEAGWHAYLNTVLKVEPQYQQQFNVAALTLKALEDKTYRGAMIASPSIPWGGGPNANEPTISGYHAVWSRDLYQVATAFLAMGDRASANRALDYLFNVQQKSDGSFPQNSWVDGRPIGGGLQLDQVALPLVLAYQLQRTDRAAWLKHIMPAAEFILRKGPATEQERWEEKHGFSPSTIAAEIAGLVCAAQIADSNSDKEAAARYLNKADEWSRAVEAWTATRNGPHAKENYFLRITENENPNDGASIEINSGGGSYDEREIVDAGFLELVRLGIKPASDAQIERSLGIIDRLLKVQTPAGSGWYRYNHDAYGERADGGNYDGRTGTGRLWTLLTGERGEYDVARGDLKSARKRLDAMMAFANDGMMIPEQVWDRQDSPRPELRFGEGTGSATPLAWSMAQFVRLAINIKQGHNVETPKATATRYLKGSRSN
ncbi:MAG TPA: glycoside hydrolase family 15 protein [Pyrinomonadaceae bacterium]|nr:glycoside hydrolase family 15 protein [Pyrinomonadaceae bacterium]